MNVKNVKNMPHRTRILPLKKCAYELSIVDIYFTKLYCKSGTSLVVKEVFMRNCIVYNITVA